MKKYAEAFYKSVAWQNCRNSYIKKVGGLCEECYKLGRITPAEEVHHKIPITPDNVYDPCITLSYSNLIALCREHHRREHGLKRRYFIDKDGNIHPRDPL